MYGCAQASIVYGFNMGNQEYIINTDWMEEGYPEIKLYAKDMARNYLGEAIYGMDCKLDIKNGSVSIDEQSMSKVEALYDKYITYLKDTNKKIQFDRLKKSINLGYQLAVSGYDYAGQRQIILDSNLYQDYEEDNENNEDTEYENNNTTKYRLFGLPNILLDSCEIEPSKY